MAEAKKPIRLLASAVNWLSRAAGALAGIAIIIILLSVCYEVVMRYVFVRPTIWSLEMSSYLFILSVTMSLGYVLLKDGHVKVDLLVTHLSERKRVILDIVTSALSIIFCGVIAWLGWEMALRSFRAHYVSSSLLEVPLFLPQLLLPVGFGLFGLQFIVKIGECIGNISGARRKKIEE